MPCAAGSRFLLILSLCLTGLLAACGGSDESVGVSAAPTLLGSQSVGPNGGSLTIDAATLSIAPGALASEVPLTIERLPVDAAPGALLRLRLAPAGARLTGTASQLTVSMPGAAPDIAAYWVVEGTPLLASYARTGDSFAVPLSSLGFGTDGKRMSLALRKADSVRALASGSGDSPGELRFAVLDCREQGREIAGRLAKMGTSDNAITQFEQLSDALLATAQRCDDLQVRQVRAAACAAQKLATDEAQLFLPTSLTEMKRLARLLLGTEAAVQRAGADCGPVPNVNDLLAKSMAGYLAVLSGQLQRGDFASQAGARELKTLFGISAECQFLGLAAACDRLTRQIFPDLLDGMREAAFNECRSQGTSLPVSQFLDLGVITGRIGAFLNLARFSSIDVEADLMQCTSPRLGLRMFTTVAGVRQALPGRDIQLQPMRAFNDYRLTAQARPLRDGQIVLEGLVAVARCPNGSALAADLVVRIATNLQEVARRPSNGTRFTLDTAPIDLSVPQLLSAAALNPATAGNLSLIVRQEGGACGSLIDETKQLLNQPVLLFQLDLLLEDAPPGGPVTWSGNVSVNVEFVATLRGSRTGEEAVVNFELVKETTTEAVDLRFGYSMNLPVAKGTELAPGVPVSLSGPSPTGGVVEGSASVDSSFVFRPAIKCVQTQADRGTLSGTYQTKDPATAQIEFTSSGELRIAAGGMAGEYLAFSEGTRAGFGCGFFPVGSFSQSFSRRGVAGEQFRLDPLTVVAAANSAATRISGSAVASKKFSFSCESLLSKHLTPLSSRLVARERQIECRQIVSVTWSLVRD